jgi:cell division transport system permease protein
MLAWLRNHLHAAGDAVRTCASSPLSTALSVITLAAALALPLALFVLLQGAAAVGAGFELVPTLSVYLQPQAGTREREGLERTLRTWPGVAALRTVTKEAALADLGTVDGMRDMLAGLPGNPLPDTLIVTPSNRDRSSVAALKADAEKLPAVASVEADVAWVERLDAIVRAGEWAAGWLAIMLAIAVVAATFNTVRLQVLTRAREIEVSSLLGGTRPWLRRPFLYFGAVQGVLAGGLAVTGVAAALAIFAGRLGPALVAVGLPPIAPHLPLLHAALTLILATLLGWLGAWLAVGRHLATGASGS